MTQKMKTKVKTKIRPQAQLVCDGEDIFFIIDGTRIAKRGRPGTPEAMTWVTLQPGWSVTSSPDHKTISAWEDFK